MSETLKQVAVDVAELRTNGAQARTDIRKLEAIAECYDKGHNWEGKTFWFDNLGDLLRNIKVSRSCRRCGKEETLEVQLSRRARRQLGQFLPQGGDAK